jgi:DNA polymerase III subunit delta
MVAPSAASAARFLSAPPGAVRGFLFYGSDILQIAARAECLARRISEKLGPDAEVFRLHDADLATDPSCISIELTTGSLFGGTKIVWLTSLPAKVHPALAELVSSPIDNAYLIVQAPDVKKSHKILQAFEAAPYLAAIPSYGEDRESLSAAIQSQAASGRFEISSGAAALIAVRCDYSALLARTETEKLMTFAGSSARITIDDVEACLPDQQTSELSEITGHALNGDAARSLRAFERFMAAEQNVTPVLAVLSQALLRLHALRMAADSGVPVMQAIKDFRPPIFFKQQDALAGQVRRWPAKALAALTGRLNETLKETRLKPALADGLTIDLLLGIAREAGACQREKPSRH